MVDLVDQAHLYHDLPLSVQTRRFDRALVNSSLPFEQMAGTQGSLAAYQSAAKASRGGP
jgi:hypothetical protein